MTNQTYHLIPEPAGDWQEGDRGARINYEDYRLRPVPAQAGQLWRDLEPGEPIKLDSGDRWTGSPSIGRWQHPVPAQACACEGLRTALAEIAGSGVRGSDTCWGNCTSPGIAQKALAQSCSCHQSGEQPGQDLPDELDFRNGGQKCDMLTGPCACGAWHKLEDLAYRIFHQLKEPQPPAAASEAQVRDCPFEENEYHCVAAKDYAELERELNQATATVAALRESRDYYRYLSTNFSRDCAALRRHISDYDEENENYRIQLAALRQKLDASGREWLALTKDKAALESCIAALRLELAEAKERADSNALDHAKACDERDSPRAQLKSQSEAIEAEHREQVRLIHDRDQWREKAEEWEKLCHERDEAINDLLQNQAGQEPSADESASDKWLATHPDPRMRAMLSGEKGQS